MILLYKVAAIGAVPAMTLAAVDLSGLALVIAAVGPTLAVYLTHREAKRAALRKEARDDIDRANAAMVAQENRVSIASQNEVLAATAANVDGNLSKVKEIADMFAAEVLRVAQGGAPTPHGEPSERHPVTLSVGKPTVAVGDSSESADDTPTPEK